jgi:hypothetical protein
MNTTIPCTESEPRWKTYLMGASFAIPAVFIFGFTRVFLLPKLETIWRDAGFEVPAAITSVQVAYFLAQHFVLIAAMLVAVFGLLEWRSDRWSRYRRASVGVAAFLTNAAVLVFITAMFMTALMAAPALLHLK